MKLSILICHLPERGAFMLRLMNILQPQLEKHPEVELIIDATGREMMTGTKRNKLMERAHGTYTVFVDVDDRVSEDYLDRIMEAMQYNPDVIPINGVYTCDGKNPKPWVMRLGLQYKDFPDHFQRWPNHIAPMKRELIKNIKFPDKRLGEDFEWSKRIHEMKILKTEVHIPSTMYYYDYVSTKK